MEIQSLKSLNLVGTCNSSVYGLQPSCNTSVSWIVNAEEFIAEGVQIVPAVMVEKFARAAGVAILSTRCRKRFGRLASVAHFKELQWGAVL